MRRGLRLGADRGRAGESARASGAYGAAARGLKALAGAALVAFTLHPTLSVAQSAQGAAPRPEAQSGPVTLLALGDSLTHGYGLPEAEGFVPRLQAWLRERGHDVTVINAGVSGDTTQGGRARLDWSLSPEVDAVIVELGGNDLLRGIDPATSRANLDAILTELSARGLPALIAGLPAPLNYGEDWKTEFDAIFPELAEAHGAILYPNFLAGIGGLKDREAARAVMQEDGIHPNAAGVDLVVEGIGPAVEALIAQVRAAASAD